MTTTAATATIEPTGEMLAIECAKASGWTVRVVADGPTAGKIWGLFDSSPCLCRSIDLCTEGDAWAFFGRTCSIPRPDINLGDAYSLIDYARATYGLGFSVVIPCDGPHTPEEGPLTAQFFDFAHEFVGEAHIVGSDSGTFCRAVCAAFLLAGEWVSKQKEATTP